MVSGTATLDNTIVELNTNGTSSTAPTDDVAGTVSSASAFNLIGTGGSGALVNGTDGNQVGVANPGLGTLADNGGPTQTIALLAGSPAINAGSNALAVDPSTGLPLATDQRGPGFPRIVGGTVDIGAYEVQGTVVVGTSVTWGTRTATLETALYGLRLLPAGRNTDLPWIGIDALEITLSQAAALSASDVTVIGATGINYGPVTISGSGMSYTITLAQPINEADRVTITIGNATIATFTRELDVLPGDFNDDGVVNSQDLVLVRNEWLRINGAVPTIFGDLNGDGVVNIDDYNVVRAASGTTLPPLADPSAASARYPRPQRSAHRTWASARTRRRRPRPERPRHRRRIRARPASRSLRRQRSAQRRTFTAPAVPAATGMSELPAAGASSAGASVSPATPTVSGTSVGTLTAPLTVTISKPHQRVPPRRRGRKPTAAPGRIRLAARGRRLSLEREHRRELEHSTGNDMKML